VLAAVSLPRSRGVPVLEEDSSVGWLSHCAAAVDTPIPVPAYGHPAARFNRLHRVEAWHPARCGHVVVVAAAATDGAMLSFVP
jgi:uncharacterized protein (DUF2252 family)